MKGCLTLPASRCAKIAPEIDLQSLSVSRTLPIANTYLLQGSFLWGEQPDSVGGETCI